MSPNPSDLLFRITVQIIDEINEVRIEWITCISTNCSYRNSWSLTAKELVSSNDQAALVNQPIFEVYPQSSGRFWGLVN